MNIARYDDFFHDGSLIDIQQDRNKITFLLSSAEMDPEDLYDDIPLSPDDTLRGKLHMDGVKKIKIDNVPSKSIKMISNKGDVFHLDIRKNSVRLEIIWLNYLPKPTEVGFSVIEIEAEKIYWEPIPDLVDPFW
jgi:hypothetical protein